uniref:uncharacterized protein C2orf72 homolog n=1 Tax=Myodes glareolus TaxID=447135 RepID=UPI0020217435|nr:uncharacterized protein C2orf72 homolog [Myodes glareolus]
MESELEPLTQHPASPAELPFQALVEAAGGRGQVLLVGELWEREQSRALLRDFSRAVFPPEPEPEPASGKSGKPGKPGHDPLREMLRDVRGRRPEGAALVGVLVADAGAEDAVVSGLQLLETLLRSVFGSQVGGSVQAAAFRPGSPASSLEVQEAACRALQAAGPGRPAEVAWERPGLLGLLTCFSWGPRNQRKSHRDATSSQGPAQEHLQVLEEELALTAMCPNGDCEDRGSGARAQDGVVRMPPEPLEDTR